MKPPFSGYPSYAAFLGWILRRPGAALAAVALITLFFAWQIPDLAFRTSVHDFAIEDLPETEQYRRFKALFGSDEIIRVVIRGIDPFTPASFERIAALSDAAAGIPGVRRVISLSTIREAVEIKGKVDLKSLADLLRPAQLFTGNLLSADGEATALTLVLAPEADGGDVVGAVSGLLEDFDDLAAYQIGMPVISEALGDFTRRDFLRLPPATFLLIGLLLHLLFRSRECLLLPLACVMAALVWTFGAMALFDVPLTMLTMIVPIFVIAVGTAYCLYLCSEYRSRAGPGGAAASAVQETFSRMALPTTLAVFTTGAGVASLLVNRIRAIQEFAVFSCVGIAALLVLVLVLFPSALVLFPETGRRKTPSPPAGPGPFAGILERIIRIDLHHRWAAMAVLAGVAVVCGAGIFRLQAETNPVDYLRADTPVSRHFHDIYRDMSGSFPVNVVMKTGRPDSFFDDPAHLRVLDRLQRFLETLPGVDKTLSFADYVRLVNYAMEGFDPAAYRLPEEGWELRTVINNFKTLLGDDMLARFMSPDFSRANLLMLTHIASSGGILETRKRILAHVHEHFPEELDWEVTGFGVAIAASSHVLVKGQVRSLALTAGLIFTVMFVLFLSLRVGLVAIVTCAFPIVVNFGLMGWLGIRLSVATSLIASIALGLAVDDIIHYLVRYNREFKKDLDKDRALRDTIRHTGRPILLTSLIISIGFSILLFSHFKPTAVFGLLMVITMGSALVGDLILLPSLMLHVELVTAWDILRLVPAEGGISPDAAHELNQPLNVIKMASEYLKLMLQRGEAVGRDELAQVTGEIGAQVDRATAVVHRLAAIGRKPTTERGPVDLNAVIAETEGVTRNPLRLENIELAIHRESPLPPVLAHRNRLDQALFGLVANAREAMSPDGGRITIASFRTPDRVGIRITDTGPGIPAPIRDRIFEPFFTTRGEGKGKGLGLAVGREIARSYGGRLDLVRSAPGGTTFEMTFPPHGP